MATQLNRGLAAVVANPQKSFTDFAVDTERRKRARKDQAISEARQLLVSKQAFSPYAGAVNGFINNAVEEIAASDDLDPRAYTQAVEQYMEYYTYSKQVEGFLKEAASSYQKDKEVNETVAAKAIMDRYVKDRSLDELATIAGQQMDAEDVVLKTPGALKTDVVIEERLKRFGDIILEYSEQAKKAKSVGGGNMVLEGENIAKKYQQYIKKDGDNIYVDPQALQDKGFFDVLMSDARVKAIAERELEKEGVEAPGGMAPVEEKKAYNQQLRDKLSSIMTPFVDYTETRKDADRFMSNWYARRSSGSSSKPDDAAFFNNWHQQLMSKNQTAGNYLKGAKLSVASLPLSQSEREFFGNAGDVVISEVNVKPETFTRTPGAAKRRQNMEGMVQLKVRLNPTESERKVMERDGKPIEKSIVVPISYFADREKAALLYEESRSVKNKVHYGESEGTAGATSTGSGMIGNFNINTGRFE